jgi:hypothetical protein
MTDPRNGAGEPDSGNGTGHLDDEYISAHLDDAVEPALRRTVTRHLEACERCRQRLAALDRAREVVRRPVTAVVPAVRAEAVDSALRTAGTTPRTTPRTTQATPPSAPGTGARPASDSTPRPIPLRRRTPVLVGAAAAVLALVGGVSAGVALVGSHAGSTTAGSAAVNPTSAGSASRSAHSGTPSSSGPERPAASRRSPNRLQQFGASSDRTGAIPSTTPELFGTARIGARAVVAMNLGPISSVDALRSAVMGLLLDLGGLGVNGKSTAALPYTAAPADNGAAGIPTTMASSAAPPLVAPRSLPRVARGLESAFSHCLAAARRVAGSGRAQSLGTTSYRGTAGLVYLLGPTSGPSSTGSSESHLVVVTRGTCHELASTVF